MWISSGAAFLAVMPGDIAAQTREGTAKIQPVPQQILDRQRTYDNARARREPVTDLLANAFVEIQADGRVLTRAQAVEKYTRFDDLSAGALSERRTASYGDVVIIAGRTGEEGTPYSARRLYLWIKEVETWRLLVFQKTFMRSRTAKLSPFSAESPTDYRNGQPGPAEEETLATRDPALLRGLLVDDSVLVDGYGEQLTGLTWLARLNEAKEMPLHVRSLSVLYQGEAVVVIGDEVQTTTGLAGRFTRVWTRSPQGMQLRASQTTFAAIEVFGPLY
jgi:hypothetical protein